MNPFTDLSGTTTDLDTEVFGDPDIPHKQYPKPLRRDYQQEQFAWWETENVDGGSTAFEGLGTVGGEGELVLTTGAASSDTTAIEGPTVNWDNWSEIRAGVWGMGGDTTELFDMLLLADDKSLFDATERISIGVNKASDQIRARTESGGNYQTEVNGSINNPVESVAMRIYEHNNDGHSVDWFANGQYLDGSSEGRGFPAQTDLTLYHSVSTNDGTAKTRRAGGWLIQLIP